MSCETCRGYSDHNCPCCQPDPEPLALEVEMTEGVPSEVNPGSKDYLIHLSDGSEWRAIRRGNKWEVDGERLRSLRECKEYLCDNPDLVDDDCPAEAESIGTWGCIDPCAILVLAIRDGKIELDKEIQRTLDARGAMGSDGSSLDIDWAVGEFKRVSKLLSKEVSVHDESSDQVGSSNINLHSVAAAGDHSVPLNN